MDRSAGVNNNHGTQTINSTPASTDVSDASGAFSGRTLTKTEGSPILTTEDATPLDGQSISDRNTQLLDSEAARQSEGVRSEQVLNKAKTYFEQLQNCKKELLFKHALTALSTMLKAVNEHITQGGDLSSKVEEFPHLMNANSSLEVQIEIGDRVISIIPPNNEFKQCTLKETAFFCDLCSKVIEQDQSEELALYDEEKLSVLEDELRKQLHTVDSQLTDMGVDSAVQHDLEVLDQQGVTYNRQLKKDEVKQLNPEYAPETLPESVQLDLGETETTMQTSRSVAGGKTIEATGRNLDESISDGSSTAGFAEQLSTPSKDAMDVPSPSDDHHHGDSGEQVELQETKTPIRDSNESPVKENGELQETNDRLRALLEAQEKKIVELHQKNQKLEDGKDIALQHLEQMKNQLAMKDDELAQLKQHNAGLAATGDDKNPITTLQEQLMQKEDEIQNLTRERDEALYKDVENQKVIEQYALLEQHRTEDKNENEALHTEIKEIYDQKKKLEEELKSLQSDHVRNKGESNQLRQEIKRLAQRCEKLETEQDNKNRLFLQQLHKSREDVDKKEKELQVLQNKLKQQVDKPPVQGAVDRDVERQLKKQKAEIQVLNDQAIKASHQLRENEKVIEELKQRLSKVMSNNLMDKNPNIADLSDANRPTKLAEKYSELYDNQWTEAFDKLSKVFESDDASEIVTITALREMLLEGEKLATQDYQERRGAALQALMPITPGSSADNQEQIGKAVKDVMKLGATMSNTVEQLTTKLTQWFTKKYGKETPAELVPYIEELSTICVHMACQDPPCVFGKVSARGDAFNTDEYKPYTSSGGQVDYCVWPPLLLHKNGNLMAKGVAQGMSEGNAKSKKK